MRECGSCSFSDLAQEFKPEDGRAWEQWDPNEPLFRNFCILGPKSFHGPAKPVCLYRYPPTDGSELCVEKFCFVDGLKFANLRLPDLTDVQTHVMCPNPNMEEVLFMNAASEKSVFSYCLRFRASPWTRPALLDDAFEDDVRFYAERELYPTCLFAFCFVSTHPFHSLLFRVLRELVLFETEARSRAPNIYFMMGPKDVAADKKFEFVWPGGVFHERVKILEALSKVRLPQFGVDLKLAIGEDRSLTWRMPVKEELHLQMAVWARSPVIDWITLDDLVKLLAAIMLENYIVVLGHRTVNVVHAVTLLPQIVNPFVVTSPVITMLPPDMFELMESPMASILGICAKFRPKIPEGRVVIDLDNKVISFPEIERLPRSQQLRNILEPIWGTREREFSQATAETILRLIHEFMETEFAAPIVRAMVTKACKDGAEGTRFVPELFLPAFSEPERAFIAQWMDTLQFQSFKEQKCRQKSDNWVV